MNKIELQKKDIIVLIFLVCIGALFAAALLCVWGSQPEIFTEIITGMETFYAENKCEKKVLYLVLFIGVTLMAVWVRFVLPKAGKTRLAKIDTTVSAFFFAVSFALFGYIFAYGKMNWLLVFLLLWGLTSILIHKTDEFWNDICLFMVAWLDVVSCIVCLSVLGKSITVETENIFLIAALLSVLVIALKRVIRFDTLILVMQLPLPFLLSVFLMDRYKYNGEIIRLPYPLPYYVFIGGVISICLLCIVKKLADSMKSGKTFGISIASCVSAMVFFTGYQEEIQGTTQMIVGAGKDVAEQVIAFQQLLSGSSLFKDYFPVSGLFSVPIGGVLELLGGTFEREYLAFTIFRIIFICALVLLLSHYIDRKYLFLLSVCFVIPVYDRFYVLLIGFLILYLPELADKYNLWLKIWIWTCFLVGLYYPMYGVALLLGSIPLGLRQIKNWGKTYSGRRWMNASVIVPWIITLVPIVLALPLLFRMARHLLVYATNEVQAFTRRPLYGGVRAGVLFSYLEVPLVKQAIVYFMAFAIPLLAVWLSWLVFMKDVRQQKTIRNVGSEWFTLFLITLFSASEAVSRGILPYVNSLYLVVLLLIILTIRSVKMNVSGKMLLGLCAILCSICGYVQRGELKSYLINSYSISSDYMFIGENSLPRLGTNGFIGTDYYIHLQELQDKVFRLQEVKPDISFTMLYGSYSTIYILDIPACGQLSPNEITDEDNWEQLKETILEKRPAIGISFRRDFTYRLYHWLMTTDEYKYSPEYEMFLPVEVYETLGLKEDCDYNTIGFGTYGIAKQAAAKFGNSIETLEDALVTSDAKVVVAEKTSNEGQTKISCELDQEIDGAVYDFLYIDMSDDHSDSAWSIKSILENTETEEKNVTVQWEDESLQRSFKITCAYGDGKLLIPVGTVNNWLLTTHSKFTIFVDTEDVTVKEICPYGLKNR